MSVCVFKFKKYLGKRWIGFRGGGISISVSQDLLFFKHLFIFYPLNNNTRIPFQPFSDK